MRTCSYSVILPAHPTINSIACNAVAGIGGLLRIYHAGPGISNMSLWRIVSLDVSIVRQCRRKHSFGSSLLNELLHLMQ